MRVRFIGGPIDGQIKEVNTPQVYIQKLPEFSYEQDLPSLYDTEIVTYNVHKLAGDRQMFYFACEGSIDEALERLLFQGAK